MLEVTKLDSEAIHRYIKFYYRDQPYDESLEFTPMRICDLTERFMEHRFDVDAFINSLPKVTKVEPSTTHPLDKIQISHSQKEYVDE